MAVRLPAFLASMADGANVGGRGSRRSWQSSKDGGVLDRTRGDHRQYVHPARSEAGTVTIPGHPGDDLPTGTLNSILKKAGLKK